MAGTDSSLGRLWNPMLAGIGYLIGASTYVGLLLAGASTGLALVIVCPSYVAIYLVLTHRVDPLPSQAPQYRLRHAIVLGWATVVTVLAVVVTI